ncbi:early nodulin-like protein 3 [Cucumis sativus]|uniref:early nodulin-like protein 3 n=1 Tax=Cucumis sativus TaxID=3659 RepID=UPI0012F4822A|nr:early nodulin-like protein 3 [Cucumis sativus]
MAKLGFAFGAVVCVMMFLQKGEGTQFIVGGAKGWSVSMAQTYNQWAEANRFQIGDSLVFNYDGGQDSVLQVTQDDYTNCNIQSPIKQYSGGHSVFQFDKSGPYYFISGNKDNCLRNEKLVVIVLADRSNSNSNQTTTSPISAPSPSPSPSPSPQILLSQHLLLHRQMIKRVRLLPLRQGQLKSTHLHHLLRKSIHLLQLLGRVSISICRDC